MRIVWMKRHLCYFCNELATVIIVPETETTDLELKLCTKCACDLKDLLSMKVEDYLNLETDEIITQEAE